MVYPESAPENWREILQQTGLQCAVSPLHDADKNADETEKKAHWHVIMCYSGPTAFSIVEGITGKLNAPAPMALEQIKGYYRYLTHKDNPEKVQYDAKDIEHINGFNPHDFIELSKSEVNALKQEILKYISENGLVEYAVLLDMLMVAELWDMLDVAMNHTIFVTAVLASWRHMAQKERGLEVKDGRASWVGDDE